jgi:hypothetical protein
MEEHLRGPFEKFVDWWQCASVMQREEKQHKNGSLPPDHELFKQPS